MRIYNNNNNNNSYSFLISVLEKMFFFSKIEIMRDEI